MPAVSTNRIGPSSVSTIVSTASRVVPGMSWTTERSSPIIRLKSVDFPTFGRPTIETEKILSASGSSSSTTTSGSGGNSSMSDSRRSPVPRPWSALTGNGSPTPKLRRSQIADSRLVSSTLFATKSTGRPRLRRICATRLSSSVIPTVTSTTNSTTSASKIAFSLCFETFSSRASPPGIQPPVSTRRNSRACHSATTSLRSRVTPAFSSTIASRRPTMRLNSVDFPTFGRPTMATRGSSAG